MKTLRSTPALLTLAAVVTVATVALFKVEISVPAVFDATVGCVAVVGIFGILAGDLVQTRHA